MWYQKLLQSIIDAQADTLLVVDAAHFLELPVIQEQVKRSYPQILPYRNELQLRLALRKHTQNMLVVFIREQDIPFAFLSMYAVVHLDITRVFPLFDREALLAIPYEDYAYLYAQYATLTAHRYEKLSSAETEQLLEPLLTSEEYTIQKRILELRNRLDVLKICSSKNYATFGEISQILGELLFIEHDRDIPLDLMRERTALQQAFAQYIAHYYEDFVYTSQLPMHAHVLRRIFEQPQTRSALICFDCMGFEEWQVIKEYLEARTDFRFEVNWSFTMLPSETHYSRTTLFAGRFPKDLRESEYVPGTLEMPGTFSSRKLPASQEEKFFRQALQEEFGIAGQDLYFYKSSKPAQIPLPFETLGDFSAIGIIFSLVDQLTHNKLMTKKILLDNIRTHLRDSRLDEFVLALLAQDFHVYLTSDHGSIYAHGNNVSVSKDWVDERARRYLINSQKSIAEHYLAQTEHALLLQLPNMLGEEFLLILTDDSMFAGKNTFELTHGGISLEEVVVPFIEVKP